MRVEVINQALLIFHKSHNSLAGQLTSVLGLHKLIIDGEKRF